MPNKSYTQTSYQYQNVSYSQTQNANQEYAALPNYASQPTSNYNLYGFQNNQNVYNRNSYVEYPNNYSLESQVPAWNQSDAHKVSKPSDKSALEKQTIDIFPKDLSPCSNLDLIFPEFERNVLNKDKYDSCLYKTKYSDLPSCSQVYYEDVNAESKQLKSCQLPRPSCEIDYLCSESDNLFGSYGQSNVKTLRSCFAESCQENYKYFDLNEALPGASTTGSDVTSLQQCYLQPSDTFIGISSLDEALNDSDDESDIIVEDSDTTDQGKDLEPTNFECLMHCIVCNSFYNVLGPQLYLLTSVSPLTITTQTPIYSKLQEILGENLEEQCYMCNICLNAINNLDQLYSNWERTRNELISKYTKNKGKTAEIANEICSKSYSIVNFDKNIVQKDCYTTENIENYKTTDLRSNYVRNDNLNFNKNVFEKEFNDAICDTEKTAELLELNSLTWKESSENLVSDLANAKKPAFVDKCFKCKVCAKVLTISNILKQHSRCHKSRFYCKICKLLFKNRQKFIMHKKLHLKIRKSSSKVKMFRCKYCKKPFRRRSHLKDHENFCSGNLPFPCKINGCDKKFPTISKLKIHCKSKHEKKFVSICSICNVGFVKASDYKAHISSHSNDKKYNCPKCDKAYKTLGNLNFHMKFHDKKLPFSCTICEKGFMRKEYLEAHVNGHEGVKNFACPHCDKKFVAQKNLDIHLKYHDGNLVKKTCKVCGKTVTSGMEEHMRTHNNLREFECEICLMRFNTKGALAKHKKRKHS